MDARRRRVDATPEKQRWREGKIPVRPRLVPEPASREEELVLRQSGVQPRPEGKPLGEPPLPRQSPHRGVFSAGCRLPRSVRSRTLESLGQPEKKLTCKGTASEKNFVSFQSSLPLPLSVSISLGLALEQSREKKIRDKKKRGKKEKRSEGKRSEEKTKEKMGSKAKRGEENGKYEMR